MCTHTCCDRSSPSHPGSRAKNSRPSLARETGRYLSPASRVRGPEERARQASPQLSWQRLLSESLSDRCNVAAVGACLPPGADFFPTRIRAHGASGFLDFPFSEISHAVRRDPLTTVQRGDGRSGRLGIPVPWPVPRGAVWAPIRPGGRQPECRCRR